MLRTQQPRLTREVGLSQRHRHALVVLALPEYGAISQEVERSIGNGLPMMSSIVNGLATVAPAK
jgi:hypothetical protein